MPELALQVQKIPKKKQQAVGANEQPKPHCLRGPKLEGSSSVPFFSQYIAGAMQQQQQSSPQTALQAQDALMSSLIVNGPFSSTAISCSYTPESSTESLDETFGRVWHLLEDSYDQSQSTLPLSDDICGNGLADLEPLPLPTELTVAEKWRACNQQYPPMSW